MQTHPNSSWFQLPIIFRTSNNKRRTDRDQFKLFFAVLEWPMSSLILFLVRVLGVTLPLHPHPHQEAVKMFLPQHVGCTQCYLSFKTSMHRKTSAEIMLDHNTAIELPNISQKDPDSQIIACVLESVPNTKKKKGTYQLRGCLVTNFVCLLKFRNTCLCARVWLVSWLIPVYASAGMFSAVFTAMVTN